MSEKIEPCTTIREANLAVALNIAIKQLAKEEAVNGPNFKSGMRDGLESNLAALESGMGLRVVD